MDVDFLPHCRTRLLMVDCPWVVQMSDVNLEERLLKPGPQHDQALMWALLKIDPDLQEYFHRIGEKDRSKEIVRLFTCTGLVKSTESNKVLGTASRKELQSFWDTVLNQLCLLQEFETADHSELCCDYALPLLSAVTSDSDFWDLLEKTPNLLDDDIIAPPLTLTLEDLKIQLAAAQEQLADVDDESQSLGNEFNHNSELPSFTSLSEASSLREDKTQRNLKNLRDIVAVQKRSIDDHYKKFVQQLVMVIKKSPQNPVAGRLAQAVVALHSNVKEITELSGNLDEIKHLGTLISSRTEPKDLYKLKDSVRELLSSMTEQTTSIIHIINTNKGVLGL